MDLEEPTSFLDHVVNANDVKSLTNFQRCLNHEFLQEQLKKLPGFEKKDSCMDVIATLPYCDGQAADAVSAYTLR